MAKQLNVNLAFTADTSAAKRQLQELQKQLSDLINSSGSSFSTGELGISQELNKSIMLAATLKTQLQEATNVTTGQLDLVKFNNALQNSGLKLRDYRDSLVNLGPAGEEAFLQLTQSIARAEAPMISLGARSRELLNTLGNTFRWQMASGAIHGVMGAIQGAVGYAQDLNKSLNDIRIVTKQSTDQMAVFAKQANAAAQELGLSTTAYTNAALIYYQQGLDDEAVAERTRVTAKLSNVTGESAEEVSSYMTAIWNNFAKGGDNLELFADKITALGAATASSSEEIANGLEKFASLGSAIGLSYDDAAAALATIVSQTRQSADTVGNSLRTLLQRIESVKLGETLEDGVDLTKYSEALNAIGVSVLDETGNLKDMSKVIQDLGEKWQYLTQAQKMAVAQTVGGVRNANTLIAWMDNFEKFQENLGVAANAQGALEEQSKIYEESWQASAKRVKAALQEVYDQLLNDKVFIKFNDTLKTLINGISRAIKGLGGVKGVLGAIASILISINKTAMASGISGTLASIKAMTPDGRNELQNRRKEAFNLTNEMLADKATQGDSFYASALQSQFKAQENFYSVAEKLDDTQKRIAQTLLDQHQTIVNNTKEYRQQAAELEKIANNLLNERNFSGGQEGRQAKLKYAQGTASAARQSGFIDTLMNNSFGGYGKIDKMKDAAKNGNVGQVKKDAEDLKKTAAILEDQLDNIANEDLDGDVRKALEALIEKAKNINLETKDWEKELEAIRDAYKNIKKEADGLRENSVPDADEMNSNGMTEKEQNITVTAAENSEKVGERNASSLSNVIALNRFGQTEEDFKDIPSSMNELTASVMDAVQAITLLGTTVSSINGLFDVWEDSSASVEDKLKTTLSTTLSMLPVLGMLLKSSAGQFVVAKVAATGFATGLGAVAIAAIGIVAGLVAVVLIVRKVYEWFNKEKIAAEKSAKAAEEAKNAYEEMRNKFEELKSSLEDHEGAVKALAALKKGTEEWRDAINDINQDVLDLIEKFPELAQYVTTEGGHLTFTEEGQARAVDLYREKSSAASHHAQYMARESQQRQYELERSGVSSRLGGTSYNYMVDGVAQSVTIQQDLLDRIIEAYNEDSNLFNKSKEEFANAIGVDIKGKIVEFLYDAEGAAAAGFKADVAKLNSKKELIGAGLEFFNLAELMSEGLTEAIENSDMEGGMVDAAEQAVLKKFNESKQNLLDNNEITVTEADRNRYKEATGLETVTDEEVKEFLAEEQARSEILDKISNDTGYLEQIASEEYNEDTDRYDLAGFEKSLHKSQGITENINNVQSLLSQDGKLDKNAKEAIQAIENEYIELGAIQNKNSYEYLNRLREIREQEEENAKEQLNNIQEIQVRQAQQLEQEINDKIKEYDETDDENRKIQLLAEIEEDTESYQAMVERLEKTEVQIKATFEADFDSDIDSAFGLAEEIEGLSKIVGDSLEITYKQAQEIIEDGNGAILQNAKETANGTIELNKETVNSFLDNKQTEMEADRQARISQLESMKTVLQAQRNAYAKKVEHLKAAAKATNATDAAESLAKAKLMDVEIANNQTKLNAIMKDEKTADENITENQSTLRQFIEEVDSNIAENAGLAANSAIQSSAALAAAAVHDAKQISDAYNEAWKSIRDGSGSVAEYVSSGMDAASTFAPADAPEIPEMVEGNLEAITKSILEQAQASGDALKAIHDEAARELSEAEDALSQIDGQIGSLDAGIAALKSANSSLDDYQKNLGSGKGSSGGGGKSRSEKEKKELKEEEDRYHNITSAIEQVERALDRLGKTKDRVYGKAKLKYLDQEIAKLEQRKGLEDEYIKQIKGYLSLDQAKLQSSVNGTLQIDSTGRLTNYEDILQNLVNDYNGVVNSYNGSVDAYNGGADESIMETAENYLKTAEDAYNKGKAALDQYEETYKLLQDELEKQIDLTWELYDLKVESIKVAVDFELHWNEKDVKYLDWLMKYIGDDTSKGTDKIANLAKQMDVFAESIDWAKQGIAGIFANHNIKFDFDNADPEQLNQALLDFMHTQDLESQLTQEEGEMLEEYMQTLMDNYDDLYEKWKAVHEQINTSWDAWNDRLDRETKALEQYGKTMDGIKKIIDLTGRKILKISTEDINKMNQSILQNSQAQLAAAESRLRATQTVYDQAKLYKDSAWTDDMKAMWGESFEAVEDDYYEALNNYYNAFADTMQKAEDAFSQTMENLRKDYNETLGDLTLLTEQFDRKQEIADLYLDDYEKYHELNKSMDQLQKSIVSTDNVMMKTKLLDLSDEINASLTSGVQISQAQAEIYARRVALLQAEAELLDAQNAKSEVRMTRDNEGNFSYTYTADQDAIDSAEQNYADKFYELLDYERNYMDQIQSEMLQKREEFFDQLNELAELYKDDQEAYEKAAEDLYNDFLIYEDFYVQEQDMDMREMARLRDEDWKDMEYLTKRKLAEHDDFIEFFHDTIYGSLRDSYQTATQDGENWKNAMSSALAFTGQAVETYQVNTSTNFEKAGVNIDKYGARSVKDLQDIADQSDETAEHVDDMTEEMVIDMLEIMNEAYQLDSAWATVMDSMRNQISNTVGALGTLLQKLEEVRRAAQQTIAEVQAAMAMKAALGAGGYDSSNGGKQEKNGGGNPTPSGNGKQIWYLNSIYNGKTNSSFYGTRDEAMAELERKYGTDRAYLSTTKYDTGGYTGAWGPEGKVALLHEKELVLNKEDTSNILSVVNTVRDMLNNFGNNALNTIAKSLMNSGSLAMAGVGTMDQNVHIEANFPNVQSHTEIELALNNLINSASQYVNKK